MLRFPWRRSGCLEKRRARTCRALPDVARRLPPLLLTRFTTTFCPLRFRDIYLQKFELFLGFGAHKAAVDSKRKLLLVAKQNTLVIGNKPLPISLGQLQKSKKIDDENNVVGDIGEVD